MDTINRFNVRISLRTFPVPSGTSYCAELKCQGRTKRFAGTVTETDAALVLGRACVLLVRTLKAPSEIYFSINDAAVCAIGSAIPALYGNNWRDSAGEEPANVAVWQELCQTAQAGHHKLRRFTCLADPAPKATSQRGIVVTSPAAPVVRANKYAQSQVQQDEYRAEFGELSDIERYYAGFPYGAALIRAHRELTCKV